MYEDEYPDEEIETGKLYAQSPATGNMYLVTKWVSQGDGRFVSLEKTDVENADEPCPYCGGELDTESDYDLEHEDDILFACNSDRCVATAWTIEGWYKEQDPESMLAGYL